MRDARMHKWHIETVNDLEMMEWKLDSVDMEMKDDIYLGAIKKQKKQNRCKLYK